MSDSDFAYEIGPVQQRVDALRQRAAEGAVQPEEVLPEAVSELQNTLEELQATQEELALTRFEPFFTTKSDRPRGGLGLGLSVSKSLVEAVGGLLDFHSQVGQGTVFEIVVPVRQHEHGLMRTARD